MQNLNTEETVRLDQTFASDILQGLSAERKSLPSKYFYDEKGDTLFQQIMALREYYLTDCEYEIFEKQKGKILEAISEGNRFQLIELGAGDGKKTKLLLRHFTEQKANFDYYPIDISGHVLKQLNDDLKQMLPKLSVRPLVGDYFDALAQKSTDVSCRKVLLFLGSTIGNFTKADALGFLARIGEQLVAGDVLLIGIDLKKDPSVILKAYNDSQGITKAFNLNLLDRINRELNADFDTDKFIHYPYYDPQSGECRSSLISTEQQTVNLKSLNKEIHFKAWEAIHTEVSNKYDLEEIEELAKACGFKVKTNLFDSRGYFVDSVWEKV